MPEDLSAGCNKTAVMKNSAEPIRLGIVGCGAVARIAHLKALRSLPQFDVRMLCDRNREVAHTTKRMFGLRAGVATDLHDLSGQVDAALVCVWPKDHYSVTRELLEMGLDVMCEKPITTASDDAIDLVEAAERKGRIVAVGQWCRYLRCSWILKRLLDLQFLGEICEVSAEFGGDLSWPMATGAYFDPHTTRGGVMFDAGVHVLDLVVWLFGGLRRIEYRDDSFGGMEANAVLSGVLDLDGHEVPCRVAASWTHALFNGVRVRASRGEAELRFDEGHQLLVRKPLDGEPVEFRMTDKGCDIPFRSSAAQQALLEDFANAVRFRRPPVASARSAILPLVILEEAYAVRTPIPQPWVQPWLGNA